MRYRDGHDTIRPSLPRLRNKASLGRLNAYGGVLDFEVSNSSSSNDKQHQFTVELISSISSDHLSLAGSAVASTTTSHDYNTTSIIMQGSSKQQDDEADDYHMHTPKKNTSQATLRALKMLDRETAHQAIKHSTSSSVVILPIPIPTPDLDHHHHPPQHCYQSETEQAEQQRRRSHSQSRSQVNSHGQAGTATITSGTLPISSSSLDADADVDVEGVSNNGRDTGIEEAEEEKDEERLVREIREDMDDGGYASLEQILARNGFQVCRIATPPSTERVAPRRPSITSSKPPATESSSSSSLFHPLSKVISGSSSTNTATSTARSQSNTKAREEEGKDTTQHTVRNKSSMLSFSGFVSTLWGNSHPNSNPAASIDDTPPHATDIASTAMNATSRSTSTVPKPSSAAVMAESSSNLKDIHTPSPSRPASKPSAGGKTTTADNEVNTGGKRMDDRHEDIKGWLRQTVEATNAYMNEARNAIEAAKAAMGSPDHKKTTKTGNNLPSSCTTTTPASSAGIPASDSRSSLATRKGTLHDEGDTQDGDLPIIGYERRQGTQSTLESAILETPTSSPLAQQIHPSSSSSCINVGTTRGIIASNGQPVPIHSPPYSPPLKQTSQVEAQITTMETSYFDSPFMKKTTKRVIPAAHDHPVINTREVQYPPSSPIEIVKAKLDTEAEADTGKKTAEDMLRGTLRHALSESSLRREGDFENPDTMSKPAVSAAKTGYRPSIATIFGIPMTFGTSTLRSDEEKRKILPKNVKQSDSNSLKESTAESLSTIADTASHRTRSSSAASTSAKDTISSSSTSNAAAPKLLRKTASKHTLRKAASPVLSNAVVVHRDEEYAEGVASSTPTLTPTPTNKGKSSTGIVNTDMEPTPVRNRPTAAPAAVLPRGPVPLKYANTNGQNASGGGSGSTTNNGTPRQVAHRNPRDSPVGETKVLKKSPTSPLNVKRYPSGPPLALSTSSSKSSSNAVSNGVKRQQSKAQANDTPVKKTENVNKNTVPSIMDRENDESGLWSPPRPSIRNIERTPLGSTRNTQATSTSSLSDSSSSTCRASSNNDNKRVTAEGQAKKMDQKPRLKAKESLERILAYKQMQEEALMNKDKKNEGEIPPVPALPSCASSPANKTESKQAHDIPLIQAAMIADNQAIIPEDGGASASRSANPAVMRKANTLKSKSSFTGTLRGILGSAVSGWTDSLPTASVKSQNPTNMSRPTSTSSPSSRRVTILPANYRSNTAAGTNTAGINNGGGSSGGARPGRGNKSIRRAKSMYVSQMEAARIKREEEQYRGGSGWIAMERDHSNSLILPTIIISDYTHD